MDSRLTLRPYVHGDAERFTPRGDFAQEHEAMGWPLRDQPPPGHAWTLCRGEAPVGVGGIALEDDGCWHAWAYLSDLPVRDWPQALFLANRVLTERERRPGFVRFTAEARCGMPGALGALRALGFRKTGRRHAARVGEGVTYITMARGL